MALVMGEEMLPDFMFANLLNATYKVKIADIVCNAPVLNYPSAGSGTSPAEVVEMQESGSISGYGSYQAFANYLIDHKD